ncbi:MAG: GtrA family protein [Lachnospiraceae bacterium]|nr:GtrA family protein [Lachnospiraceae bacterium]
MKILENKNYREIFRYLIVGGLTTVVSLGVYYGLTLTVLDPNNAVQLQIANVVSWIAAVTFAYFANRKYVFRSENKNILQEAAAFFAARIGTLLMDMGIMFVFVTLLGFSDKIMKLVVQVVVTVANYVFSKLMVFRKKTEETADSPQNAGPQQEGATHEQ